MIIRLVNYINVAILAALVAFVIFILALFMIGALVDAKIIKIAPAYIYEQQIERQNDYTIH